MQAASAVANAFTIPFFSGVMAPQVLGALVDLNSIFCLPNLVRWWQVPGYNYLFGLWASHFELENSLKEKKKEINSSEYRAPRSTGFASL